MANVTERLLRWYTNGETGLSSKAIAGTVSGYLLMDSVGFNVPHDPSDLRRCVLLLRAVPEARENGLLVLAQKYPMWAELAKVWDELVAKLIEETHEDLPINGMAAPQTYRLMRHAMERGRSRLNEPETDSAYSVVMTSYTPRSIELIKAIRTHTSHSEFKDADTLISKLPASAHNTDDYDDATIVLTELQKAGADVTLREN